MRRNAGNLDKDKYMKFLWALILSYNKLITKSM